MNEDVRAPLRTLTAEERDELDAWYGSRSSGHPDGVGERPGRPSSERCGYGTTIDVNCPAVRVIAYSESNSS